MLLLNTIIIVIIVTTIGRGIPDHSLHIVVVVVVIIVSIRFGPVFRVFCFKGSLLPGIAAKPRRIVFIVIECRLPANVITICFSARTVAVAIRLCRRRRLGRQNGTSRIDSKSSRSG
jgi:hypothetical protein